MAIYLIGKIKPKNDGGFALVDAADIEMSDGTRLDEYLEGLELESGYYRPMVNQLDNSTIKISFTASKEGLPALEAFTVTLPAGPQGEKGEKGDTGAQGPQGEKGEKGDAGKDGRDGKTAYEYAVEGGYSGDEEKFAAKLAMESTAYPVADGATEIQPEIFYTFGEVSTLNVSLVEADDGLAHEYCFEFVPAEDFDSLTITPAPVWAAEPQYPVGKTCQVSILRGIGVMVCA